MARRHRRKFTDEFKAETVKLIRESGRTVGSVAKELSLTETAVRNWVKNAEASGSVDALQPDELAELKRLRKENQELRMEKEILRKATAFFAKESR
jgi:transposase